jgi:hypothetical protein
MSSCVWNGTIYIWGGRDTQDRDPQFYNDLWAFDPGHEEWSCLAENAPDSPDLPSPRYGMGAARLGNGWHVFGGFGQQGEFLPEEVNGPQLNDLWRYDLQAGTWSCLYPHDGSKVYGSQATRPGVRRVPGMVALDGEVYLLGGLDLASGPNDDGPVVGFNDFWQGTEAR